MASEIHPCNSVGVVDIAQYFYLTFFIDEKGGRIPLADVCIHNSESPEEVTNFCKIIGTFLMVSSPG